MSSATSIRTERLELIPGTADLIRAEIGDRRTFSYLLNAVVPHDWRPPLNERNSMEFAARYLEEHPDQSGRAVYYFVLRHSYGGTRTAIGTRGYKGKPTLAGTVESGYSITPAFQGRGDAPEVVTKLVERAFQHEPVHSVLAGRFRI